MRLAAKGHALPVVLNDTAVGLLEQETLRNTSSVAKHVEVTGY